MIYRHLHRLFYNLFLYKQLSLGLNRLSGTTESALMEMQNVLQALQNGDLTIRMSDSYQGLFAKISRRINAMAAQLQGIMDALKQEACALTTEAQSISNHNERINSQTTAHAESIQTIVATISRLSRSILSNSELSIQAKQQSDTALLSSSQGDIVVQETIEAIDQIHQAGQEVNQIITTINHLAFQTSLLSLNASVEAARAGDTGRGFAVVAEEVRNLAKRSSTAAKSIESVLENSAHRISQGRNLAHRSGAAFKAIHQQMVEIQTFLTTISRACAAQGESVIQVDRAMQEIEQGTQKNQALTNNILSRTHSLTAQAQRLNDQVTFFDA